MTRLEELARAAAPDAWSDPFWTGAVHDRASMGQPAAKRFALDQTRRVLERAKGLTTSAEVIAFINGVLAEHPTERG